MKTFIWISTLLLCTSLSIHAQTASQSANVVRTFAYSPDGKYLVLGCNDGIVQIRDNKGKLIQAYEIKEPHAYGLCGTSVDKILFEPNGYAFYALTNCTLYLLDVFGNKYSKFQTGDSFKDIFLSKGGDTITIVHENLAKFVYSKSWQQLDYFNFSPKLDLPKNIVYYPVLYGSAITKNGNFIAVYDKPLNRKKDTEYYITEYDKKNNPIRNLKLNVPVQETKLNFSFNAEKNIAYIHVNSSNNMQASGFIYDANTGELKSLFGLRDESNYPYSNLILNPDGTGFIEVGSSKIRFVDFNGKVIDKYENFPYINSYSMAERLVYSEDYKSIIITKSSIPEMKNLKMETLLAFEKPSSNQILNYSKLSTASLASTNAVNNSEKIAEKQKPVSKLQDKDLVGSCEELLIRAEDTDDPTDYMVIAKKALELAGNDIALKVAAKAAIVEYHCYKKEIKEGEALLNEISLIVKGTTDLYANYKYQYAVADLLFVKEEYSKAASEFEKALNFSIKYGKSYYIKQSYQALAESNYWLGNPLLVIENLKKGISIPNDERNIAFNGNLYNRLATICSNYGKGEEALQAGLESLKIFESLNKSLETANLLMSVSNYYVALGDYKNGISYLQQAIKKFEELGKKDFLVECYAKLSRATFWNGSQTEAIGYAQKSYGLAKELGDKFLIARAIFALVVADININADSKMLERLNEGYAIAKEVDDYDYINAFETWLGFYHDLRGDFNLAIPYYQSMVTKSEKARANVPDELKLDFWKNEYSNYQNIIACHLHLNEYTNVINSIEKSTARLLYDRISTKMGKNNFSPIDINNEYKNIPSKQAVLFYGSAGGSETAILTANNNSIGGKLVNTTMWVKTIQNKYTFTANDNFEKLRAFKKLQTKKIDDNAPTKLDEEQIEQKKKSFEEIVNNYRALLSKPNKTQADLETLDFLGRKFYQLLIKPIEDKLVDKTELVIIPNDVLAFLPYEAFIMTDGKYLVEKYDISYLPSYSTGQMLAQRSYPDTRKPIIAFGNAIYNVPNQQQVKTSATSDFAELMKGIPESASKGENMRKYFTALGYEWDNLPGTQAEVDAILALQPTASLIKGKDVNKQNVIKMSQQGMLKNYKILHFATHGVVIPEFQELSAIVLTQGLTTDDGYLRASEISKLNINADFVNLSACETGLGKIYGGEGVVGLTQAFLLAGANSISVSLWQVSDQSTMEFQKEFYRLVFVEKMPISKAINQVKRTFIKGQYNQPFYWAPFVYYGM